MSMSSTFGAIDWKPEASGGNRSQVGMPFLSEVPRPQMLAQALLARLTFSGALVESARFSGKEDQEIADEIHISHGYMSRFMRGVAQQWAKRLVAYMRATNSLAPLQWLADQMGCDVAPRAGNAARIRELEEELRNLRRSA
jgi:transcriptional regulator with XRE-family HTH domain